LYTDGVTEAFNGDGDEFGEERLIGIATLSEHAPSALLDDVFAEVRTFCGDTAQSDDVTMIALRYR
jgi:sigma-B regulation protein RsbU (phosphoserine phosphatase)